MNREQQRFELAKAYSLKLMEATERGAQEVAEASVFLANKVLAELDRTKPEAETLQPDADGWIPHRPTDQIPTGDFVVKFNDGTVSPDLDWSEQAWLHGYEESAGLNIVAWKPA